MKSHIATNSSPGLLGLDAARVWDTEAAFEHLKMQGEAETKRTAERRLNALRLLPDTLASSDLLDELDRRPNRLVLEWAITQAKKRRHRLLFVQLNSLPGGRPCLHANDAREARFWIPLTSDKALSIKEALIALQEHIGKPLAVFPHGPLVGTLRGIAWLPSIHLCPQAYQPVLPAGLKLHDTDQTKQALSPHLKRLEAESIHMLREAVAEGEKPVMLYTPGKSSSVMVHLARKAFYPELPPLPLLHIDTRWQFQEMYLFRDFMARESGMDLLVHTPPETKENDINLSDCHLHQDNVPHQVEGLKQALEHYQFDVVLDSSRREEALQSPQEQAFSYKDASHIAAIKNESPEPWNLHNIRKTSRESIRMSPLANWTELDLWQYICQEHIPVPPLYFAKPRPVVIRAERIIMVDDERCPLLPSEMIKICKVRFRTLGCYPLSSAIESEAETVEDILIELINQQHSKPQKKEVCS